MAGDWIKWAKGLQDKPEVFRMSIDLSLDRYSVAGRLMVVWAWADDNVPSSSVAENGDATVALGAQQKQLVDAVAGVPGFADSMSAAGWISQRSGSLVFPNFARHNGETAKTRVLAAERMKKSRTERNKCCDATVTKAQPEKSRVEKSKEPPPTMSAPAINDQRSTIDAEWAVVVVDLEKLGMDNPDGVCRASDWSPAAAKALVDHFINHREAEGWGVGLLRSKLLAAPLQDRPDKILTLKKSGRPAKSEHGDPADPEARWLAMDSASQDRWRMELLARHRQAIEGLGPEGRMSLLPGENLAALRRILAVSEPRWLSSKEVAVRLLLEMERRVAAAVK